MRTRIITALAATVFAAAPASAQMWDSPTFFAPRPGEDLGLYLIDSDGGGDVGVMAIWRQQGNLNLGVRGGVAGDNIMIGSEFFGDLTGPGRPLLMAWNLGVGATFADNVTVVRVAPPLPLSRTVIVSPVIMMFITGGRPISSQWSTLLSTSSFVIPTGHHGRE